MHDLGNPDATPVPKADYDLARAASLANAQAA
jgi:hypothetical protein